MRETVDRALRRQRVAVLAMVALGIAYGLALRSADDGSLLPLVPMLLLLVGGGMVIFRGPSRESLRVDPTVPAMYAPPRHPVPFAAFAVAWLVAQVVQYGVRWDQDPVWWPVVVGSVALAAHLAVDLWRQVPLLTLTPAGIGSEGPRHAVLVPWSALAVDQLVRSTAESDVLRLALAHPELVERRGRRWWRRVRRQVVLGTHGVDTAPEFLAAAVRHYLDHPEHRPAIGTAEEYARLPRALGGGGPAAG